MRVMLNNNVIQPEKGKITDHKILNIVESHYVPRVKELELRVSVMDASLQETICLVSELKNKIKKLEKKPSLFKRIISFLKGLR